MSNMFRSKVRKIGFRILALVGLSVAIVVIAFGQFYASREEQTVRALSERDMQRLMETVIRSIESIMLPGQAAIAQSFAERLKTVPDVVDFRIMRADGTEAFRDNQTLNSVNARLDTETFPLREREEVVRILSADDSNLRQAMDPDRRSLVSFEQTDADGSRLLTFIYAIPNRGACSRCHGAERPYLGAIKLSASMSAIDAKVKRTHQETWIATAVSVALLLVVLGAMIHRSVIRPIQSVTRAMERAAGGDLKQAVPVPGNDEIGQMAHSFNVMLERLHSVYTGLRLEQDKLNTVIQSTGEGVVVTDGSGSIVLVNDAAVRLLGKRRERIVEDGFMKLLDNSEVVKTLLERQTGPMPTPYKIAYKGRTLRVTAATIRAQDGHTIGSAALLRDITPDPADVQ